jgi:hypothetical protein
MLKRLVLIGALVISMVALFGSNANAQFFDGWGWFGFSSLEGEITLHGIPNPTSTPTVVIVTATLGSVEIICLNPNDKNRPATPGNAGTRQVTIVDPLDGNNSIDKKKGTGTSKPTIDLSFAEDRVNCVNPNWDFVTDSAAVTQFLATMQSFRCIAESKTDPNPCIAADGTLTIEATPRDSVSLSCTINGPVVRDPNTFQTVHRANFFNCVEI